MTPVVRVDPVAAWVFTHEIRWYSLAYIAGFLFVRWSLRRGIRAGRVALPLDRLDVYLLASVLSMYLWGRVGYELVYDFAYAVKNPLVVFTPRGGGLAFHGSMIGIALAALAAAKRWGFSFLALADELAVSIPLGIALGRIGNFLNQELWGRVTDVPWAVVFPAAGPEPRHPSQLYESVLEGWLLLIVMRLSLLRPMATGTRTASFLMLYALARFVSEQFRQPDAALGFVLGPLSMGQVLSLAMGMTGIVILRMSRAAFSTPITPKKDP